jgi:Tir chaperone protein (CesT) family
MRQKTRLGAALDRIGARLDSDLSLDSFGSVRLRLQGDVYVELEQPDESPFVYMYTSICDIADVDRAICLDVAMRRNFFNLGAPNAWLALDPETSDLLLCSMIEDKAIEEDS